MKRFLLFFLAFASLFLIPFVSADPKCIWKSSSESNFSFKKYDDIYFYIALPSNLQNELASIMKQELGDFGKVVEVDLEKNPFRGMAESQLDFFCYLKNEGSFKELHMYASTLSSAVHNKHTHSSNVWEKTYLLKDETSVLNCLNEGVSEFLQAYKKSNGSSQGNISLFIPTTR